MATPYLGQLASFQPEEETISAYLVLSLWTYRSYRYCLPISGIDLQQVSGHLAKVCQSGQRNHDQQQTDLPRPSRNITGRGRRPRGTANRKAFTIREPESGDEFPVLRVGGKSVRPIMVEITINGKKTQMELDTGAAVSIISTKTKAKLFPEEPLVDSSLVLTTYLGEQLQVAGQMLVNVKYGR